MQIFGGCALTESANKQKLFNILSDLCLGVVYLFAEIGYQIAVHVLNGK
jgi:hypothetical protein